jgi:hypothetical protein
VQLRPEQLAAHLSSALLPLYIISGEEPLQREESIDAIRAAARAQQFNERTTYHIDRRFDWSELGSFGDALSLFAERRIVEVRAPSKLDDAGRKALTSWCERLPEDVLMILVLGYRVDRKMAQAKWFSALDRAGAHLAVSPIETAQMPRWMARRAQQADLQLDEDACSLLAERAEGNLLAGAQEVDKLALLYGRCGTGTGGNGRQRALRCFRSGRCLFHRRCGAHGAHRAGTQGRGPALARGARPTRLGDAQRGGTGNRDARRSLARSGHGTSPWSLAHGNAQARHAAGLATPFRHTLEPHAQTRVAHRSGSERRSGAPELARPRRTAASLERS